MKKILIVEDEYFLSEIIKARLEFMGYIAHLAENGEEALAFLKKEAVDLIIMDYMMPVMDGLKATEQIKADPKLKKIPILFLTAKARPEDEAATHNAGADDYLAKPFEMDELMKRIEKWV